MENADQLIAGYTAYTDAADFGASAEGQSPATTPTVTTSSHVCLTSVAGSIALTYDKGC